MISRRPIAVTMLMTLACAGVGRAQSVRAADSVFQSGEMVRAESMYYAAARARPRDPIARWALGRYLTGRGAGRVGATLFEEALRFGGEPAIIGRDLAPLYLAIGEFGRLSNLASATSEERARARWLVIHRPTSIAPESLLTGVFIPGKDSLEIGRVPLRVNGTAVDAVVSPRVHGIVISDTAVANGLHKFGVRGRGDRREILAVADSIGLAGLTLRNHPVTVSRLAGRVRAEIGLDVLGRFVPTFEPRTQRVTVHVGATAMDAAAATPGDRLATFTTTSDVRVMSRGAWLSIARAPIANQLREHRWTLVPRRGELIVER